MTNSMENLDQFKDSEGRVNMPFAETVANKIHYEGVKSGLEAEDKMEKTVEGRPKEEKVLRAVIHEKYPHIKMSVDIEGDVYINVPEVDGKQNLQIGSNRFIYAGSGFYEVGGNNVALNSLDVDKLIPYLLKNVTKNKEYNISAVDVEKKATGLGKVKQVLLSSSVYARKLDYSVDTPDLTLIQGSLKNADHIGAAVDTHKAYKELNTRPDKIKERI